MMEPVDGMKTGIKNGVFLKHLNRYYSQEIVTFADTECTEVENTSVVLLCNNDLDLAKCFYKV